MKEQFSREKFKKEEKEIEFSSQDGMIIWRVVRWEGGKKVVGRWNQTDISTADQKGLLNLQKELKKKLESGEL